jgi:hypothetical protein
VRDIVDEALAAWLEAEEARVDRVSVEAALADYRRDGGESPWTFFGSLTAPTSVDQTLARQRTVEFLQCLRDVVNVDCQTDHRAPLAKRRPARPPPEAGSSEEVDGLADPDAALAPQDFDRCHDVVIEVHRGTH